MSDKIDKIIEHIDQSIYKFYNIYLKYEKNISSYLNVDTKILNERTLVDIANRELINGLKPEYICNFSATEFHIKNKKITKSLIAKLNADVAFKANIKGKNPFEECYIDGYFLIKNSSKIGNQTHLFVEYKMKKNAARFAEFATDYLKYKLITYGHEADTVFAYVIFDDKNISSKLYPSVIKGGPCLHHYHMINKTASTRDIKGEQVIIYFPSIPSSHDDRVFEFETLVFLYVYMLNITYSSNEFISLGDEEIHYTEKELVLLSCKNSFNERVIKSRLIQDNWRVLVSTWGQFKSYFADNGYIKLFDRFEHASTKETIDLKKKISKLVYTSGKNFDDFLSERHSIEKIEAHNKGLNVSRRNSLHLIVLVNFIRNFYLGGNGTNGFIYNDYYSINETTKIHVKNNEEIANDLLKDIENIFKLNANDGTTWQEKITNFALTFLFYICNVASAFFEIKDNEILGFSKKEKFKKIQSSLQANILCIAKILGIKERIKITNFENLDEELENIANAIINRI